MKLGQKARRLIDRARARGYSRGDLMASPSARYTLITGARLLDGSGAAAVDQAAMLIDRDRIVALGRAADVRVPDAEVDRRDYGEATILPGLVDAHGHLMHLARGRAAASRPADRRRPAPPRAIRTSTGAAAPEGERGRR